MDIDFPAYVESAFVCLPTLGLSHNCSGLLAREQKYRKCSKMELQKKVVGLKWE